MGSKGAKIIATLRYWTAKPQPDEHLLISAIADRISELLPVDEFEVSTGTGAITVTGRADYRGKATILMPMFIWRTSLARDERLRLVFQSVGVRLQQFMTTCTGEPWPEYGASVKVVVTDKIISLAWASDQTGAAVSFRPILRKDIDLVP